MFNAVAWSNTASCPAIQFRRVRQRFLPSPASPSRKPRPRRRYSILLSRTVMADQSDNEQRQVATVGAEGCATPADIEALMRKAMLEILPSMLPEILVASSARDQPGPPPLGRYKGGGSGTSGSGSSCSAVSKPQRREVPDLLSWVQCFGIYACVLGTKFPHLTKKLWRTKRSS